MLCAIDILSLSAYCFHRSFLVSAEKSKVDSCLVF